MRRNVVGLLCAVLLVGCGEGETTGAASVPFPQDSGQQALHCMNVLTLYQMRFDRVARGQLPGFLADAVVERQSADYQPAVMGATTAALNEGMFPEDFFSNDAAVASMITDTAELFRDNPDDFNRHADTCNGIYG